MRARVLSLVLGSALVASAQDPVPHLQWCRVASGPGYDSSFRVAALPGGESVTFGYYTAPATFGAGEPNETTLEPPGVPVGVSLARHAADGSLVWAKSIDYAGDPLAISAFADGSIANSTYAGDADVFVARYLADGSLASASGPAERRIAIRHATVARAGAGRIGETSAREGAYLASSRDHDRREALEGNAGRRCHLEQSQCRKALTDVTLSARVCRPRLSELSQVHVLKCRAKAS